MEVVAHQWDGGQLGVGDPDPGRVVALVEVGLDSQACLGGGGRDELDHGPVGVVKGFPRQLMEINENTRCSMLFSFEVPGGMWQTVISSPMVAASVASSGLKTRGVSAVIIRRVASG